MEQRGEMPGSYTIREMTEADIPQLAAVHAKAWADTYFLTKNPPTRELREWQWRDLFSKKDGSWFCDVITDGNGRLIGFTKGNLRTVSKPEEYAGELNKIYLLFEYHRLGLGAKMIKQVADRFIGMGIYTMILFSEAANPTGWFYEKMGGRKLYNQQKHFSGTYVWDDLRALVTAG